MGNQWKEGAMSSWIECRIIVWQGGWSIEILSLMINLIVQPPKSLSV